MTKRAVMKYTGKAAYEFGDITRKVVGDMETKQANTAARDQALGVGFEPDMYLFTAADHPKFAERSGDCDDGDGDLPLSAVLDTSILEELERWDQIYLERAAKGNAGGASTAA